MINAISTAVIRLLIGVLNTSPGTYITTKSCNTSGVPLITQTRVFESHFTGKILLIEPKEIMSPKGIAKSKVRQNNSSVVKKPSRRLPVTVQNIVNHPKHQKSRRLLRNLLPSDITSNYFTRVSSYFSARASSVPSARSLSVIVLISVQRSEPLRQPIPYSSSLRERTFTRFS